ncbi:hypothetical protein ACFFX0_08905 [Citricoccus parietis]|uniref:Uncharacterized protein n=1 Tax=Citricoccus parietis TaxID=592307 RepID=A0ABV5FYK1_9MICC
MLVAQRVHSARWSCTSTRASCRSETCTPGRMYSLATRRSRERVMEDISTPCCLRHCPEAVAEIRSVTGRSKMSGVNWSREPRTAESRWIWRIQSVKVPPVDSWACSVAWSSCPRSTGRAAARSSASP